jgi:hypothetical protein
MKRNFRTAFNRLQKLGVPVHETNDGESFWISAEETGSHNWVDYYDGHNIPEWEFGVSNKITELLRGLGLFAEWQNPAKLNVWEN